MLKAPPDHSKPRSSDVEDRDLTRNGRLPFERGLFLHFDQHLHSLNSASVRIPLDRQVSSLQEIDAFSPNNVWIRICDIDRVPECAYWIFVVLGQP